MSRAIADRRHSPEEKRRRTYSAAHWGIFEVEHGRDGAAPILASLASDPDPSPIGLDQLDPQTQSLRVGEPAVHRSWLEHGPGANRAARGQSRSSKWNGTGTRPPGGGAEAGARPRQQGDLGGSYGSSALHMASSRSVCS